VWNEADITEIRGAKQAFGWSTGQNNSENISQKNQYSHQVSKPTPPVNRQKRRRLD
jgi:hypothetical protein